MRREDDTRQPQTQADAADTSEHLSIVLFILGVTSHQEWPAGRHATDGDTVHTQTHPQTHVAHFHNAVWCVCVCVSVWIKLTHSGSEDFFLIDLWRTML